MKRVKIGMKTFDTVVYGHCKTEYVEVDIRKGVWEQF
jgi:hypothetical protein